MKTSIVVSSLSFAIILSACSGVSPGEITPAPYSFDNAPSAPILQLVCHGGSYLCIDSRDESHPKGECVDLKVDRQNCGSCGKVCGAGELCDGAACRVTCESRGLATCQIPPADKDCFDLSSDNANCGACGNTCPSNSWCAGGECVAPVKRCPQEGDFCETPNTVMCYSAPPPFSSWRCTPIDGTVSSWQVIDVLSRTDIPCDSWCIP